MAHPQIDRYTVERVCQDAHGVKLLFQPVLDLERSAVQGYEVFAEIQSDLELPAPEWFAAAVEYGLQGALEARIVRTGLAARAQIPEGRFVSVNVSPEAVHSPQLQEVFNRGGEFDHLVLEVNEGALAGAGLVAALQPFRSAGGRTAVDSLGAGSVHLRGLAELAPAMLKLDRSIVDGIHRDSGKALLVKALAGLAERLGASLVAVGIERREEVDILVQLGVRLGQGFLFGPRKESVASLEEGFAGAA